MKTIRRFLVALEYFKIVWRNEGDVTLSLLKQAKHDGHIEAVTTEWFHRKYSSSSTVRMSYNPKGETYTFSISMEEK